MNSVQSVVWLIVILVGAVTTLAGMNSLLSELVWRARWKWSNARGIKQAAKMGWNTGGMPDGTWFIVLEWMEEYPKNPQMREHYKWSVMQRRGDRVYSASGGLSEPVENVIGWIKLERWP